MKSEGEWDEIWPTPISTLGPMRERERRDRFIRAIQADALRWAIQIYCDRAEPVDVLGKEVEQLEGKT